MRHIALFGTRINNTTTQRRPLRGQVLAPVCWPREFEVTDSSLRGEGPLGLKGCVRNWPKKTSEKTPAKRSNLQVRAPVTKDN
jgi:hypothetical protein